MGSSEVATKLERFQPILVLSVLTQAAYTTIGTTKLLGQGQCDDHDGNWAIVGADIGVCNYVIGAHKIPVPSMGLRVKQFDFGPAPSGVRSVSCIPFANLATRGWHTSISRETGITEPTRQCVSDLYTAMAEVDRTPGADESSVFEVFRNVWQRQYELLEVSIDTPEQVEGMFGPFGPTYTMPTSL